MLLRREGGFWVLKKRWMVSEFGETLGESGRCIDALKKRRRALKQRLKVLNKVCLVRGAGGGPLHS